MRISLGKRIAFSEAKCRRASMIPVIRIYLLYLSRLQTVLIAAEPASQYRILLSNTFTVNVIFCSSKANTWNLKNISCNRNEPKQYTNTWQFIEVSNSTKLHTDISGNHADLWPLLNGSNFFLSNTTRSALQKQEWSVIKGRETEKKTANVQMPRTVGVV